MTVKRLSAGHSAVTTPVASAILFYSTVSPLFVAC